MPTELWIVLIIVASGALVLLFGAALMLLGLATHRRLKRTDGARLDYKVLYHIGEDFGLKTKGMVGRLSIEQDRLIINGGTDFAIPINSLRSVDIFRPHGTGRVIKITHTGGTAFVCAIHFSLSWLVALGSYFETGQIYDELKSRLPRHRT